MSLLKHSKYKRLLIGGAIILIAGLAVYGYFKYDEFYPSTDDAYVGANLVNVASKVNGYLETVNIKDNQLVHKGDVLFTIESKDYALAYEQAYQNYLSQVSQTKATFNQLEIQKNATAKDKSQHKFLLERKNRYTDLYKADTISKQSYQDATTQEFNARTQVDTDDKKYKQLLEVYKLTQAKESQALAALKSAKNNLDNTQYKSPVDGYITNLGSLTVGEFIASGIPLFGIVDKNEYWINANFKETELSRIRPNQVADITLDMYAHDLQGVVQSVSYASGNTFSLLPAQNATGNWVKVTQRFLVRIKVTSPNNESYPLRVGASAKVVINTFKDAK